MLKPLIGLKSLAGLRSLAGFGAASAMLVTGFAPALAAPIPAAAPQSFAAADPITLADLGWDQGDERASQWRRGWRNRGWLGRNRIDGGDILAGALILGGIAAVASAVSNSSRNRDRDLDRNQRIPDDRFSYNDDVRSASSQCGAAAAAQSGFGARVERIDNVVRDANGWRVEGLVGSRNNGVDSFTCGISYGRIDYVTFNRANGAWGAGVGTRGGAQDGSQGSAQYQGQVFGDDQGFVPPQPGDDDEFAYQDDAAPFRPR